MLFVGYFEGLDSQRAIAWRCSDSLSLRAFLGIPLSETTPDHSSLTKIRQRLPLEVHERVFAFVLGIAHEKKLLRGKTVAVDTTTLEANAAMKSIVRKDSGEDWKDYLKRLMAEQGIDNPTDEEIRRFDKKRKKKVSNQEWQAPADPESRIAKMKDGTTHLAYKAEHTVDVDSEFVLAAAVHAADQADSATLVDSRPSSR
jgi:transposase